MQDIKIKLTSIREKLHHLKEKDPNFAVFGSDHHRYTFNPILAEEALLDFESKWEVKLPGGYRRFLREMGNGGLGPYYGIKSLEKSIIKDQLGHPVSLLV